MIEMDNASATVLKSWLEDLVCPVCYAALRLAGSSVLCIECGRKYPVEDGIPVLIADRAGVSSPGNL